MSLLQKISIALTGALVALTLTGCSSAENLACEQMSSGSQVESITVTGTLDEQPTVSFPTPISADFVQAKMIVEGNGPVFTGRNLVEF